MKQALPNLLTATRLFLALPLLFAAMPWPFLALYLLCCLTDLLDGFLARRLDACSLFGARLDSAADLAVAAALIPRLWHLAAPGPAASVWIAAVAALRLGAALTAKIRFGRFGFLHTWGNKLSGLMLALYPFSLLFVRSRAALYILLAFAGISALEELIIELQAEKWMPDRRGLFCPVKDSRNL